MKVKGMRWWVLGLIVLVTIINYLDRNTLGIMWAKIVEDLGLISRDGLTLVPLDLYLDARGRAKMTLAVARGKKLYDKREDMAKRDAARDIDRRMKDR